MQKEEKMLETVMPHNREAEMAVLGSMILNREATGDVSLILKREEVKVGLFQGMFDENIMTWNPTDVRSIQKLLKQKGIEFDVEYREIDSIELKIAFITDPSGVYIELTEGYDAY